MFTIFLSIQYIGIIVLLIEAMYIIRQKPSRQQLTLLVVVLATLINFVGYLFEIKSTDQEMALQAVKFLYLGKPYIILATFLFAMEFYRVRIAKWVKYMLCILHTCISILVFTCDQNYLFYDRIGYTREGYFPHLVLGHSPLYVAYSVWVLFYLLVLVGTGIYRYRHMKNQKERKQILYMMAVTSVAGAGFCLYFSGLLKGYDCTLPAYLICAVLLLIAMLRYDLLDAVSLVKDSVFDEFTDGLLVVDHFQHIAYANETMKQLFALDSKQAQQEALAQLNVYNKTGETLFWNDRFYEVDRKDIVKNDTSYGQMIVARDVTQHRIYTASLEEQKNIAQKANQAKTDFLAKMSHEIRTPINAILGMNEMILRESEQTDILHYAMDVKTSANALLAIINDILDTSKIESGKLKLLPVQYELDSLLNDVVNMAYGKAREKDLAFYIRVEEHIPNGLFGDDVRIRQILVNILNNAIKYTEQGSVTLQVQEKERLSDGSSLLHFSVCDTGIGIKEEDLPKLTAAFERIEEDRNRNIEGTGLGMSIVVELLHRMGAELEVQSVYGEGSVFSFEIRQPVWDAEQIGSFEERSRRLHEQQTYEVSFVAPEAKLLVVDDNATNRNVLKGLLKQNKIQIDEAESGCRCLERVKEKQYDIIFLDHMMPDMNGVETLHRMRETEINQCKDTPVIVLTANAVVGAREKYIREGFTNYLSKPIQVEKLEEMILSYLPEEKVRRAEPGKHEKRTLPELLEFDFDYARHYLKEEEVLWEAVKDVYQNLEIRKEQLEKAYDTIEAECCDEKMETSGLEDAVTAYQIQVHSLKSDTAMIGALLLSNLARMLEVAAMERNISNIRTLHPILLEEIGKHKKRLSEIAWDTSSQEMAGFAEVNENIQIEDEGEIWI